MSLATGCAIRGHRSPDAARTALMTGSRQRVRCGLLPRRCVDAVRRLVRWFDTSTVNARCFSAVDTAVLAPRRRATFATS
jgi:hypothetical protein